MTIKHPSPRRGSALAGAIVVIFMLLAVVMALHHYQGLARQTYMAAEADLRFREGTNFAVQKQLFPSSTTPSLAVTAAVGNVTPANTTTIGNVVAANIFDRANGLPDLRALENSPAHTYLKLTPTTPDVGLKVFGNRTYSAVLTQVPGFAIFAPKGSVNVTDLRGWSNPTFQDPRSSVEAFSGVPAVVAALTDANVTNCTYGEAYAINGKATIGSGQGVAFQTKEFPVRNYTDALVANIAKAKDDLRKAAKTGDKTSSLVSDTVGPSAVVDLMFGGGEGLEQFLSLRNANHFWLPVIPAFLTNPPYLWEFSFSVPFPPDTADYTENPAAKAAKNELEALNEQYKNKGAEVEAASKKAEQKSKEYDQNQTESNRIERDNAIAELNARNSELEDIKDKIEDKGKQLASYSEGGASSIPPKVPPTRSQDPSGTDGQDGFCFSFVPELIAGALKALVTFDGDAFIQPPFANDDVKLVHFGSKDRQFGFQLSESNMVLDATTTVPRGRTLKLRSSGTITIRGDLWIQRGATFVAECPRLVVEDPPGGDSSSFFTPSGRIFLEEGATLVCSGAVEAAGSSEWGSVVVGGVPGKIHPITSAILADGGVKLPHGVFAASAIDDLVEGIAGNNAALKGLNDHLLRPLLSNIGPNAAKAVGPFWARKPYFAKYVTTVWIIFPPILFGAPAPIPVPVAPVPLPRENMLNKIARALAYVYSTSLNMSLGENFYTHSDWWIFGEGTVPMVPQMDPVTAATAIANFPNEALDALDPGTIIKNLVENVVKQAVKYVVVEVLKKVVTEVATSAIPYGGWAIMIANVAGIDTDLLTKENSNKDAGDQLISGLGDTVKQAAGDSLNQLRTKFDTLVHDKFLREYNGVLVTGDTIEVGGKNATGMFVARQALTVTSERCVGTLVSTEGNVNCRSLLFYPYFNRASLYVPKETADGWLGRAAQFEYDSAFASGKATDVGPPAIPMHVAAQGWAK